MRAAFNWLLRQGMLYLLLVGALLFATLALPALRSALTQENLHDALMSPRQIEAAFEAEKARTIAALATTHRDVSALARDEVSTRLAAAKADRDKVQDLLKQKQSWFRLLSPRAVLERQELRLREKALDAEIDFLTAASARYSAGDVLTNASGKLAKRISEDRQAYDRCAAATRAYAPFQKGGAREHALLERITGERQRLWTAQDSACGAYNKQHRNLAADLQTLKRARDAAAAAKRTADAYYQSLKTTSARALSGITIEPVRKTLRGVLLQAAALLALAMATPFLIRTFLYFVLAPLAARSGVIHLGPGGGASPGAALSHPSATSAAIRPGPDEELLVRQGYLQSTSTVARAQTQWLLDWRHPLSSLASGLVFLTRVEGEGQMTNVSAVHDPLSEVAVLDVPGGAGCVLHPRALAGVVQPKGRPVRITSRWRLFSPSAWLTLQLRYLTFHGPVRLIIKGARGVRVELAGEGRIFAQDQLVGFSADLSYAITRNETFAPYLFGRAPLFKDKVGSGAGLLILEEATLAAGRAGAPRRGLEGAIDAGLKAFGL